MRVALAMGTDDYVPKRPAPRNVGAWWAGQGHQKKGNHVE
jgi:hypothetical protein